MEIVTSWIEQGIEPGRQQGEIAVVMRLLKRRVGDIAPENAEKIRISIEKLEILAEALFDFSQPADLVAWLERES